mgnify:CR=1 FL=1
MRLLHVIYSGLGGQGAFLFPLIKNLKKKTNYKNIIIFYGVESLLTDYKKFCEENNIEFYYINSKKLHSSFRYINILNKLNPDIIYIHTSVILRSVIFNFFKKSKLVFVDHTSNQVKRKYDWINLFISCLFFDQIIFLAKFHQREIQENYFFKIFKSKFKLIKPGISIKKTYFKNKIARSKKKNLIKLGMASRLTKGKNHLNLIDAFKKIQNNNNINFKLSLVGTGPEKINIKNYIIKNKLDKSITLDGFKNIKNMNKWFKEIDIYVHWSKGEVVSRSILEAMQNQKIIFAYRILSTKEQLINGFRSGILFNDDKDFIDKFNKYYSNKKKIKKLRFNCLKKIENSYSINKFVKTFENTIGKI